MTDYRNVGFILQHGLHCCNCGVQNPNYINIGHRSLITNRGVSAISHPPGGVLNDYIPFYFHYKMPMLYHIYKGYVNDYIGHQSDIVYMVTSVEKVVDLNLPYLFTDRHAYLSHKRLYNNINDLNKLSWPIIRDDTWYIGYSELKKELKQAEFLVHQHVPVNALIGFVTYN